MFLNIIYTMFFTIIAVIISLLFFFILNIAFVKLAKKDDEFIAKRKEIIEQQRKQEYYEKQKNMQYNNWKNPYNTASTSPVNKNKNEFPDCLIILGFSSWPKDMDEIKNQYRNLAKTKHPDMGGSQEEFEKINKAYQDAQQLDKYKS